MQQLVSGSVVPDTIEERYTPFWDSKTLSIGALGTKLVWFETPAGASKGVEATNVPKGFELQSGQSFDLYALRCVFLGTTAADMEGVLKAYRVSLLIGGKPFLEGPVYYFASGAGVAGFAATTATTTTLSATSNGVPDPRAVAMMPQANPIRITAGDTFRVEWNGSAGYTMVAAGFAAVILEGLLRGPIR